MEKINPDVLPDLNLTMQYQSLKKWPVEGILHAG